MRGAEPLALNVGGRIRTQPPGLLLDGPVVGSDDHGKGRARAFGRGAEHMRQQRLPRHRMQHLRHRGAHPRALAGREHDREAGSNSHLNP